MNSIDTLLLNKTTEPYRFYDRQEIRDILSKMDKRNARVLDLGCGVPTLCFDLEREFKFSEFVCIDKKKSEEEIIDEYALMNDPGILQFKSFRDLHYSFTSLFLKGSKISYERVMSYNMTHTLITDCDITKDDLTRTGKFDVIILKDILHLMPYSTCFSLCAKVCDLIAPGGLLYIQVPHYENSVITDPKRSYQIGSRVYEHIYIAECAYLMDEFEFLELVAMFGRHGIEGVVGAEVYGNFKGPGNGGMGFVGRKV